MSKLPAMSPGSLPGAIDMKLEIYLSYSVVEFSIVLDEKSKPTALEFLASIGKIVPAGDDTAAVALTKRQYTALRQHMAAS